MQKDSERGQVAGSRGHWRGCCAAGFLYSRHLGSASQAQAPTVSMSASQSAAASVQGVIFVWSYGIRLLCHSPTCLLHNLRHGTTELQAATPLLRSSTPQIPEASHESPETSLIPNTAPSKKLQKVMNTMRMLRVTTAMATIVA